MDGLQGAVNLLRNTYQKYNPAALTGQAIQQGIANYIKKARPDSPVGQISQGNIVGALSAIPQGIAQSNNQFKQMMANPLSPQAQQFMANSAMGVVGSMDVNPELVKGAVQKIKPTEAGMPSATNSTNGTTLYHGTTPEFAKSIEKKGFDVTKTADGSIWFTDNKSALSNPDGVGATGKGAVIERLLPKDLKLATPEMVDKYYTDQLTQMGYDGVKYPNDMGKGTFYQIFSPEKLQSHVAQPPLTDMAHPFPQSVVKDTVFHGSPNADKVLNEGFDTKYAGTRSNHKPEDVGIHFTSNRKTAASYSGEHRIENYAAIEQKLGHVPESLKAPAGAGTIESHLDIQKPLHVGRSKEINAELINRAKREGYDGIIAKNDGPSGPVPEYVVFDPKQVKIVNRGELSGNPGQLSSPPPTGKLPVLMNTNDVRAIPHNAFSEQNIGYANRLKSGEGIIKGEEVNTGSQPSLENVIKRIKR